MRVSSGRVVRDVLLCSAGSLWLGCAAAPCPAPAAAPEAPAAESATPASPQVDQPEAVPVYEPQAEALAACSETLGANVLARLVPTLFDYVELRGGPTLGSTRIARSGVNDAREILEVVASEAQHPAGKQARLAAGESCRGASNGEVCQKALAGVLASATSEGFGAQGLHLVATKGDKLFVFGSVVSLRTALLPIDSAEKAALLAYAVGYPLPSCGIMPEKKGEFFELNVDIETRSNETGCHKVMTAQRVVTIDVAGNVRAKSTTRPKPGVGFCVDRMDDPKAPPKPVVEPCPPGATCRLTK